MANLRSSSNIFLVGHDYAQILGCKLPSIQQVLRVFFYNHNKVGLTVRESAALTIKEASVFWSKARIPIRQEYHCITKLEKLFKEWKGLLKNRNKSKESFRANERAFVANLNNLFDIAHADAMTMMSIEEDKAFLEMQRQDGRPGHLVAVDSVSTKREKRKAERELNHQARKRREAERVAEIASSSIEGRKHMSFCNRNLVKPSFIAGLVSSSGSENEADSPLLILEEMKIANADADSSSMKRGRKNFYTPRVLSSLDKWKITNNAAMHLMSAIAEAVGLDVKEYALNTRTLQRLREQNRTAVSGTAKNNCQNLVRYLLFFKSPNLDY